MATKNIVPRADNEGSIGTLSKNWKEGNFKTINGILGGVTPAAATVTTLNANVVKINSPDAGAVGQLITKFDSSSIASNPISTIINEDTTADNWGEFAFQSVNSIGGVFTGVLIGAQFLDHTSASLDADFVVKTTVGNILSETIRSNFTKTVFTGVLEVSSLAGTGTRNVVVDVNGVMSAP